MNECEWQDSWEIVGLFFDPGSAASAAPESSGDGGGRLCNAQLGG